MSVAGGLPRAVERAAIHRCDALQIFAKNASQWRGREISPAEVREFRARVKAAGIGPVVSHGSYLINLATTNAALRQQSMDAMGDELDRAATFTQFGRLIGFDRLRAFHLNDSKKPLGSRVDRHEHIGQGCLGLEPFRRIVNDRCFRELPMLLETAKAEGKATGPIAIDPLDRQNLDTLRGLIGG